MRGLIFVAILSCDDAGAPPDARDRTLQALLEEAHTNEGLRGAPPGRWRQDTPSPQEREQILALEAVGYVDAVDPATGRGGVLLYDPARAEPGYNLVLSGHAPVAELLSMTGEVVYRWIVPADTPLSTPTWPGNQTRDYLRRARLLPDGGLLAILDGIALVALDRDSRVRWTFAIHAHHDVEVGPDGAIYVLSRDARDGPAGEAWLEDQVTVLSEDGVVQARVNILAAARQADCAPLQPTPPLRGDVLHTNDLMLVDDRLTGVPGVRPGQVLLSLRQQHALVVLDLSTRQIVACWAGSWRHQHAPSTLDNGNLLLFDNQPELGHSRIVLLNPRTGEERVRYQGSATQPFFSARSGSVQALPNGDLLITETDRGRAVEVAPDGEIVWAYQNPHRGGADATLIASLSDVVRVQRAEVQGWLGP